MIREPVDTAALSAHRFTDSDEFVPPFPPRWPKPPSTFTRLRLASRNFLAMWEDESFDLEFSEGRVLMRKVYVCNSPRSVQFAFSQRNASFERKSPQMRHALEPLLGDGLFVSDGETWRQRRKLVAPVVHVSRLSHFAPIMSEAALETRDRWQARADQEIDVLEECAHLTAEIICRTVFGRELGRSHAADVVQGFSDYQHAIGQVDIVSLLGLPDWVPRYRSGKVRRAIRQIHAVLDDVIAKHRTQRDHDETSVIGSLLNASDDQGNALSDTALRNEAAVLFMAGHETTANTLAWALYLLSQAPKSAARLNHELDSVLGGRPPQLEDIAKLPYTRAVINETMRLYPPVPILPREALVEEHYDDYTIPKGSLVLVVPWLLHRHRKLWIDPDHFIPERFLEGSPEPVSKFAYVPFSIGPRICAGMSFGILEAVLCLATLAQSFRLELVHGHEVEPVCRLTLRPGNSLPMIVRNRAKETHTDRAAEDTASPTRNSGCPRDNV
jgi:cytochrome P450